MFVFKYSKLNIVRNSVLLQTCDKTLLNRFNWEDKNLKLYFTTNPNGHLRFLIFFHDELLRELYTLCRIIMPCRYGIFASVYGACFENSTLPYDGQLM